MPSPIPRSPSPSGLPVGDFNGDGKLDVVTGSTTASIYLLLGDGTGGVGAPARFSTVVLGPACSAWLSAADLNGDDKLDVVAASSSDGQFSVLLGNGAGGFEPGATSSVFAVPFTDASGVLVADLNGDGKPDVVVAAVTYLQSPGSTISVFAGNGDGTFQPAVHYNPVPSLILTLAAGDFNGDGLTDLVLGGPPLGVILGNPDGTFQSPLGYYAGNYPGVPVLADLRRVGVLLDLVVVGAPFEGGTLTISLGDGDGSFQPPVKYSTPGQSIQYVAVGDFNGDGA